MFAAMKEKLTKISGNRLVLAIAAIVIGLILIVFRRSALDLMIRLMGAALIVCACVYYFFFRKEQHDLLDKIVSIFIGIVGLILLLAARGIVNFFPVVIGIVIIINAFANLARIFSIDARNRDGGWRASVVLQIIVLVFGFCMMFFRYYAANLIVMLIGIALLVTGISNLVVYIRNRRNGVDETVDDGHSDDGGFFRNMRGSFRGGNNARGGFGGRASGRRNDDPIDVNYREVGPDEDRH